MHNATGNIHDNVSAPDDGPWLATLLGHQIRIKTHGKDTDGRVTVFEFIEKPHSPPPAFTRHAFVEVFCVQEGTLTFQFLNEKAFDAPAGTVITVPGLKPHTFWNHTDIPARVLNICTPAGLDRFFEESEVLLHRLPPGTDDKALEVEIRRLRDKYGVEHMAPPPQGQRHHQQPH